ncbi:carbohydrate-binding protein [Neolewinella sp.]|uniref:carbohydrate-binding protein n=1 Tax=Neolewinella sp. TaxID=2993543 RepID=UPI003B52A291
MCTSTRLCGATLRCSLTFFALVLYAGTCVRAQTIFDDDFDRQELGAFWDGNEGWTIRDGQAYNGTDNNGALLTTVQSFGATSYVLETEVSNLVGGYQRAYYLLFGQQDEGGTPTYVVRYDPLGGGSLVLGEATDNYLYPEILDKAIINLDPELAHTIRVAKYENGLIQVYVADKTGYPIVPTLEAISTTHPTLSRVSWGNATQTAGEEFFVDYLRATVPEVQKTAPEKPAGDELVEAILADSDNAYELSRLTEGETFYTDRPYTLTSVPDFLEGARFIKTANDDKVRADGSLLSVYLSGSAIAYVAYDPRGTVLPNWLSSWTKTDEVIGTTDPGSDYFEVYTKLVPFSIFGPSRYRLTLGAALAAPAVGSNMNYIVALVPYAGSTRYEAEEATLSGVRPATNHTGFSGAGFADYINPTQDYIEWTIDVPATSPYNLSATYANGSTAPRDLQVYVDGQLQSTTTFTLTGGWNNWSYRTLGGSVLLSAGEHRIRLTAAGSSGPNVDYLELSPTSVYTPPTATSVSLTVVAPPPPPALYTAPTPEVTVSVYPNPTVDAVTFEWGGDLDASDLRVVDLQGREVYRRAVGTRSARGVGNRLRLEVGDWPVGTYFYQLRSGGQVVSGRFVKGG